MTRKERLSLVYLSAGLLVALMLMPWAAQLTRADTNVQLVEFTYVFGEGDRSHAKLDFLGYDTLQVDEHNHDANTNKMILVGIVVVAAAVAISLSLQDDEEKLRCHIVINPGVGSHQVCR